MKLTEWIEKELEKSFGWFDMEFVEDDGVEELHWALNGHTEEPAGNHCYLLVSFIERDNEFSFVVYESLLDAQDEVKERMEHGDCTANGGRGGPDNETQFLILDLVERKVITPVRDVTISFVTGEKE